MNSMRSGDDQKLDALFAAYRTACGNPEPSANFMPELWARIESRQTFTVFFRRMANAFTTAAVALSLMLGIYMAVPGRTAQNLSGQSYIEALAEADTPDAQDFINPVTLELSERPSR
jgi:hypothetical protein